MDKNIYNYELINLKKDVLITYSLLNCDFLNNIVEVSILAKELDNKNYDLNVLDKNKEIIVFKNLDNKELNKIIDKKILIAGISQESNEIIEVAIVNKISFENKNKLKTNHI